MARREVRIAMDDGVRLAATLYLPERTPAPCLLEALPYRKDDVTLSYAPEYERLLDEFGYAVCRVDLRGTGSSDGIATDEYPVREQDDLVAVIGWLADQAWCTGRVGMFGTSYSGFNSIQVAMRRPPALRAIVPIYATDDRYTDDVHFMGGARRLLDLVDYPSYMVAMNALPPVPEIAGDGWREEWLRRLDATEPWLLRWLGEPTDGPYWRHGSLRPDYASITAATMIVSGWADGYRNNSLRTYEALAAAGTPARLLVGPWSHMSPARALPGPHLDLTAEMAGWFDRWLRDDQGRAADPPIVYFGRRFSPPEPDRILVAGQWRAETSWPSPRHSPLRKELSGGVREHVVPGGVGTAAWNSCAGALPWGQPTDQRFDDALSLTWEWPLDADLELLGQPMLRLRVAADQPVASISAKLCEVAPDGTSALITRGLLALTHRAGSLAPVTLTPGEYVDVTVELETAAWTVASGHTLRLAVTGMDWPNTVAPPRPLTLSIAGDASALTLPVCTGEPPAPPVLPLLDPPEPAPATAIWRVSDDVLRRHTIVDTAYGEEYDALGGRCVDRYVGSVGIDRRTWSQWAKAEASFELRWPQTSVRAESTIDIAIDAHRFDLTVTLRAYEKDEPVHERTWRREYPRGLA
jgi:uncharacterized protein